MDNFSNLYSSDFWNFDELSNFRKFKRTRSKLKSKSNSSIRRLGVAAPISANPRSRRVRRRKKTAPPKETDQNVQSEDILRNFINLLHS